MKVKKKINMQATKILFRIRSEIGILLEIILNAFKHFTVSLSTEILILSIASLSFISVGSLSELAMLSDVYILQSPQEDKVNPSF